MKTKFLPLITLVATLVACVPAATLTPTETTLPLTTATFVTPKPTATFILLQNTATPIEVAPVSLCGESIWMSPTLRKLTSETYFFTLQYPANWECDDTGDTFKYSGIDGFFQLYPGYIPAKSAMTVCETQAKQSVGKSQNQYGASPTVEILQVDNQPACLVWPSDDQPQENRGGSLLVVKYPFEYPEKGKNSTRVLMLVADKNHIRDFIGSLKFIR